MFETALYVGSKDHSVPYQLAYLQSPDERDLADQRLSWALRMLSDKNYNPFKWGAMLQRIAHSNEFLPKTINNFKERAQVFGAHAGVLALAEITRLLIYSLQNTYSPFSYNYSLKTHKGQFSIKEYSSDDYDRSKKPLQAVDSKQRSTELDIRTALQQFPNYLPQRILSECSGLISRQSIKSQQFTIDIKPTRVGIHEIVIDANDGYVNSHFGLTPTMRGGVAMIFPSSTQRDLRDSVT